MLKAFELSDSRNERVTENKRGDWLIKVFIVVRNSAIQTQELR